MPVAISQNIDNRFYVEISRFFVVLYKDIRKFNPINR